MGKRKMNRSETLNRRDEENGGEEEEEEEGRGFFACYLLTSLCPRYKGHTYIGFTVNPRRRIRQHNGEIRCGAWRTKRKRPWEMVLCIYGFPTNVAALQFEWAWQHPVESLAVRKAAVEFKSLSGVANKVKLAYTMLTLPAWQSLNLTVNYFSTKYTKHSAGCPSLPTRMRVKVCSMDDLPCYSEDGQNICGNDSWADDDDDDEDEESTDGASELLGGGIEQATRHNESSTENHNSIKEATPQMVSTSYHIDDDAGSTQARNYQATRKEDVEQPFCIRNSQRGEPFCIENSPEREVMPSSKTNSPCGAISPRLDWPANESFTTMAGDKEQPLFNPSAFPSEVEVIDVFTPSPEYRIRSRRKKRGVSSGHPQIIDLTQSPIFV